MRCAREKCASARVQAGVVFTPPVALTAVATGCGQKNLIRKKRGLRSDFLVVGDNVELAVLSRVEPVS